MNRPMPNGTEPANPSHKLDLTKSVIGTGNQYCNSDSRAPSEKNVESEGKRPRVGKGAARGVSKL